MSVRLADSSFQYPLGIAKNMLVKLGKFIFLADFVILEMEEDSKVPLILGRPFLHTTDAVIRVKQKQLNLGVGTETNEPSFLPVIISSQLSAQNKGKLVSVIKKHKEAFAWKTTDIPGICPSFCKHKIQLLDDKKPVVQKQRRLNPNMQEGVKKRNRELLVTVNIYPIAIILGFVYSLCTKRNEKGLTGNKYFCFLDGFAGYFQIPIDPNDQEKITFTCPFGTYAYRRMPFGLCNAPSTFQRCMLVIFHNMIEESIKVFMDDFSVFGNSFDKFLNNLDKMLQRCKDAHLVLNWEKCHFMVKEGIVLGHKVSSMGLEVDKAKINVISKFPPHTNIKSVRSFLGHAGFYRRIIKDFLKIARQLTKLLEKDIPFEFNDECQKAFDLLKGKLTCAPVIVSPNWDLPFKLMCDAKCFSNWSCLRKPDLTYLHVFGALCYPTNDSEDLGKLKPKANIGIFVGYAPAKKAFRIYNKRTRMIIETIHVDFDELTAMASEQFSSGPGPKLLTPGTISSGLVPNIPSSTPYVPPTKNDWEILFQPMFDEYLNPPPCVDPQVPAVIAPEPAVSTGTPSSTTIDQDAPSSSTSQTTQETPPPVIPLGVEEADHDIEVAHMDNNPYVDFLIPEPSSEESSTQVVIPNNVHSINQPPEHINKWTKDHPIDNVIGNPSRPVSTQHQIQDEALFCYFDAFLSSVEPKSYKGEKGIDRILLY
ncbi:reverse transcriptase domain-containing protein [Tanacetum coccineum]